MSEIIVRVNLETERLNRQIDTKGIWLWSFNSGTKTVRKEYSKEHTVSLADMGWHKMCVWMDRQRAKLMTEVLSLGISLLTQVTQKRANRNKNKKQKKQTTLPEKVVMFHTTFPQVFTCSFCSQFKPIHMFIILQNNTHTTQWQA